MAIFQTPTEWWRNDILAGAEQAGELHLVYYCLEMRLPKRLEKKTGQRRMIVEHPVGYMPVVRVGPRPDELPADPAERQRVIYEYKEDAKVTIDLLRRLMEMANADWLTGKSSGIEFKVCLIAAENLTEYWYEWWPEWGGDLPNCEVDRVCPWCGSIATVPRNQGWTCDCGMVMDADSVVAPGS